MITQEGISAVEIGEAIQQYVARNREITVTGLLHCGGECGMMLQGLCPTGHGGRIYEWSNIRYGCESDGRCVSTLRASSVERETTSP